MNYITAEQFKEQSKEVQETFKNWLEDNIQKHDWVKLLEEDNILWIDDVMDTRKDRIDVGRVFYIATCLMWTSIHEPNIVPLLTETQLRHFIEEKLKGKVEAVYLDEENSPGDSGYTISTDDLTNMFHTHSHDLLEAYWEVACKIAEGE